MRRRAAAVAAAVGAAAVVLAWLHYRLRPEDVPNPYASTHLTIALTSGASGLWVARRRPSHPIGWVLLAAGLLGAWMYASQPAIIELYLLGVGERWLRAVAVMIVWPWMLASSLLLIAAPSVVPAGWPAPRRPRGVILIAGAVVTVAMCVCQVVTEWPNLTADGEPTPVTGVTEVVQDILGQLWKAQGLLGAAAVVALAVVALRGGPELRRQTRWFLLASAVLAVPGVSQLGEAAFPSLDWPGDQWYQWAVGALPIALVVSVAVDGLLDAQVVVRRTVLYGGLMAFGVAVFAVASALGAAVSQLDTDVRRGVAAGATGLLCVPVIGRWQRWVDANVYGAAGRPERVLGELGRRFADAQGSHAALASMVLIVRDELRLPYVAIEVVVDPAADVETVAAAGRPTDDTEVFPVGYAGAELGRLSVGRRTPGEPLQARERTLLSDLAGHAGVVLHDAQLDAQLRASRQQIVLAREEERRRLRGDLHDGLGPTLASVSLGLDAAAAHVGDAELAALLEDLDADLRRAMAGMRELVQGLGPPALDELGLVTSLERFAATLRGGLDVRVTADPLPELPAAVEVAAYRIGTEALTNVARHAHASHARVRLGLVDGDLVVEVTDDGVGIPPGRPPGIGLGSMRDRAEELRGELVVTDAGPGTVVHARLPVAMT